jgi:N-acetylmuramic acid 6-phosphate etherase
VGPPYARLPTEQANPRTRRLDRLDPLALVTAITAEDRRAAASVAAVRRPLARAVTLVAGALRAGGRLVYAGAGTSGRLGVLDAAECPPTFGVPRGRVVGVIAGGRPALWRSVEGAEDRPGGAARALARLRALSDVVVAPRVGPEVIAGSTRMKAGLATKMILHTLTTGAMVRVGKVYGNLMVDVRPTNRKLRARAARIVTALTGLTGAASRGLLRRAGGRPKLAVLMHARGLSAAAARRRLAVHGDDLRAALEARGAD